MPFIMFAVFFSVLLDLLRLLARSEQEKDLEILLLRQQLRILQRTRARSPRLSWWERLPLGHVGCKTGPRSHELPYSAQPKSAALHT